MSERAILIVGLSWAAWFVAWPEVVALAQTNSASKAEKALRNLQVEHRDAHRVLADGLERIAQNCELRDLKAIAAQVRRLAQPAHPDVLRFEPLPRSVQPPLPGDLSENEKLARSQLREQRKEYAAKLDSLAQRAVKAGFPSYAFTLVREAVFHDSDLERPRRLLGYVRYKDEWVSPFERGKLGKNEVWTDQFGWLPAAHVTRYQNNERYYNARWMPVAQEEELRSDFRQAWEIRTEHYLLKTNVGLQRGVALAMALESFHTFFQQTFAAFFSDPEQLRKLFANPLLAGKATKQFEVHFFKSRDEYIQRLSGKYKKQIEITNGLYDVDDRIVYSFQNPNEPAETTLFHEATHQLLAAHLKPSPIIASTANFWLIEGIACYIESFELRPDGASLGDPRYIRFEAARQLALKDRYYLKLRDFTAMGKDQFQSHPRISNNYSQASGLVHFFMHFEEGQYRDALVEHLRQMYQQAVTPRQRVDSLEDLTGIEFNELDRQYLKYVSELEQAVKSSEVESVKP